MDEIVTIGSDPVASATWTFASAAAVHLSELHPIRAVGYLALSIEGLVVTWYWPRLFPPPARRKRVTRRGGVGDTGSAAGRECARSCRADSSGAAGGWGDGGGRSNGSGRSTRTSSPALFSSHRHGGGGSACHGMGSTRRERSPLWAEGSTCSSRRSEQLEVLSVSSGRSRVTDGGTPPSRPRRGASYVRRVVILVYALSISYLGTRLLLSGARRGRSVSRRALAPIRLDGDRQQRMNGIFGTPEGPTTSKAGTAHTRAAKEADEGGQGKNRGRRRSEIDVREVTGGVVRKARREERDGEADGREREAAARPRRDREEREAAPAKAERERVKLREKSERLAAAGAKQAKAKVDAEAEALRREVDARKRLEEQRQQAAKSRHKADKRDNQCVAKSKTSALQEGHSLGVGGVLSSGSTVLEMTPTGDAVLSVQGREVWIAPGSRRRRNVFGRIWRKLRRQAWPCPCTDCTLMVTAYGTLEVREKRKVLWSSEWPNKPAGKRNRGTDVKPIPRLPQPDRADRRSERGSYRLVVGHDGNAVIMTDSGEIAWKAIQ